MENFEEFLRSEARAVGIDPDTDPEGFEHFRDGFLSAMDAE